MKPALGSLFVLGLLVPLAVVVADEPLLRDDFSQANLPQRRALRGDWKIENGAATCTQDDALFAKLKNHGPIIFYDVSLTNANVRFSVKPEKTKTVVFTANGKDGHVFRFVLGATGLSVRAFPPSKDAKSISVGQESCVLKMGEWTPIEVSLQGTQATIKIGDAPPKTFEHETFSQPKVNLSVGFSFGTLSVKDFVVAKP